VKNKPHVSKDMDWREAIEFLMRLANIQDPAALREGDRLNLIDDFRRYANVDPDGEMAPQLDRVKQDPRRLQETIRKIREIIAAATDRKQLDLGMLRLRLFFDGKRVGDQERGAIRWSGPLHHVMAQFAANDLEEAEPWQVCRCKEPDCEKFFLANRKGQQFCSHPCANQSSARAYRNAHSVKRAQREKTRYWKKKTENNGIEQEVAADGSKTQRG
jgi:hypothetical protein